MGVASSAPCPRRSGPAGRSPSAHGLVSTADLASLGWIINCPPEEIEFNRVGPLRAEFEAAGPARQAQIIEQVRVERKAAAKAHAPIQAEQLAAGLIGFPLGSRS